MASKANAPGMRIREPLGPFGTEIRETPVKHGRSNQMAQPTKRERVAPQTGKSGWRDLNSRPPAPKAGGDPRGSNDLRWGGCAGDARGSTCNSRRRRVVRQHAGSISPHRYERFIPASEQSCESGKHRPAAISFATVAQVSEQNNEPAKHIACANGSNPMAWCVEASGRSVNVGRVWRDTPERRGIRSRVAASWWMAVGARRAAT